MCALYTCDYSSNVSSGPNTIAITTITPKTTKTILDELVLRLVLRFFAIVILVLVD
jgi:hypothetical protein